MNRPAAVFASILAAALASAAPAQSPIAGQAEAPPSLVRGELGHTQMLGVANCSPDPNAICENVLVQARLELIEQLAGPRVPPHMVIRYIAHMPLPRGSLTWFLVRQVRRGYRPAVSLHVVSGSRGRGACFDEQSLSYFGAAPTGGTAMGDIRCYRR